MRIVFIFLFLLSVKAQSQSPCGFINDSSFYPVYEIIDQVEESPFIEACHKPEGLLKNRPPTGIFKREVPTPNDDEAKVRNFLRTIKNKAQIRVDETQNQINALKACMNERKGQSECADANDWILNTLPAYVKEAREHLSLSQSEQEFLSWMGRTSTTPNYDMSSLGSYKEKKWTALNRNERIAATHKLKQAKSSFESIFENNKVRLLNKGFSKDEFVNQSLLVLRYNHYKSYTKMLAELPLLQYLQGPGITEPQLKMALIQMQNQLNKEKKYLEKNESLLNKSGPIDTELLELMRYNSIVEDELIKNNQNCGLATSLLYTLDNRQIGNGLALGLPVMAVSFFAPPVAAIAIGAGTGGIFAAQSIAQFERTKTKNLSHIYSDDVSELKELEMDNRQKEFDIVTLPVGLGLGNKVLSSIKINRQILNSIK